MSEPDGLSGAFAKVIELCPPCFSASDRPDIKNVGGIQWEYSFDALVIDDPADGECFVNSAASPCDYGACEYLYALFVALLYGTTDIYGVAYFKVWYFLLYTFALNGVQQVGF
jgi:hypothetical protein